MTARYVVIRPTGPGAVVVAEDQLEAWTREELAAISDEEWAELGYTPIDSPEPLRPGQAMTNLIGLGWRFERVVSSWRAGEGPS